jgi:hypothetical protein
MVTTQQEVQYAMADLESAHLLMLWIHFDCLRKAEKSLSRYFLTCNDLFLQAMFCDWINEKSF